MLNSFYLELGALSESVKIWFKKFLTQILDLILNVYITVKSFPMTSNNDVAGYVLIFL